MLLHSFHAWDSSLLLMLSLARVIGYQYRIPCICINYLYICGFILVFAVCRPVEHMML